MKNMCFTLCTEKGMYLDVYDWIEGRECVWYMGKKELQAVTEKNVEVVCVFCMLPPDLCRVRIWGNLAAQVAAILPAILPAVVAAQVIA